MPKAESNQWTTRENLRNPLFSNDLFSYARASVQVHIRASVKVCVKVPNPCKLLHPLGLLTLRERV